MFRARTLKALATARSRVGAPSALVGFDGFVDLIVTPVGLRRGQGEDFAPIATIPEFGQRVLGAAGKSTNLELYPRAEKLGGNGPIMAGALLAAGARVTCVGALGRPQIHPAFAGLAARARTFSLCAPAHTTALEFTDGKLMLGTMRSFDEITLARVREVVGAAAFEAELAAANLIALVNWTMVPHMTAIFAELTAHVLPRLPASPARRFFFDLADPEKRSPDDLRAALDAIARFESFGRVTLGLNLKEAQQVAAALGLADVADNDASLRAAARALHERLRIDTVVIHPRASAACATAAGDAWVPGPFTERPLLTTGAGDHFNAGFALGQLLGFAPDACLGAGVATSGYYVRTGQSPTLADLETFLANWR
ncbi:MAG TPA: PfkB family carbohydrate kinase [Opitutaceae bacterium]|nr:PfkB family carbohydrate kinase [Opitutaceae bacterium]